MTERSVKAELVIKTFTFQPAITQPRQIGARNDFEST